MKAFLILNSDFREDLNSFPFQSMTSCCWYLLYREVTELILSSQSIQWVSVRFSNVCKNLYRNIRHIFWYAAFFLHGSNQRRGKMCKISLPAADARFCTFLGVSLLGMINFVIYFDLLDLLLRWGLWLLWGRLVHTWTMTEQGSRIKNQPCEPF